MCEAIADGRQTILLRKGGIHERGELFEPDHREFWLMPTRFHQNPDELLPASHDLIERANQHQPTGGQLSLRTFARVEEIWWIEREKQLSRLREWHILSDGILKQRFHYRQPGLFALLIRAGSSATPFAVLDRPEYAGCKTWVELEQTLGGELQPAVSVETFEQRRVDWNAMKHAAHDL